MRRHAFLVYAVSGALISTAFLSSRGAEELEVTRREETEAPRTTLPSSQHTSPSLHPETNSAARTTGRSPLFQQSVSPLSTSSIPSSLLLLCTADGTLYAIDAWSGRLASKISTDPLLVRSTESTEPSANPNPAEFADASSTLDDGSRASTSLPGQPGDSRKDHQTPSILPGLDGRLFYHWPKSKRMRDHSYGSGGKFQVNNEEDGAAEGDDWQELPLTVQGLLEHPVQTCLDQDAGDNEGRVSPDCGILTATMETSLLAINERGQMLWSSRPTSQSDRSNQKPEPTRQPEQSLVLQRKDYHVRQISTSTGQQVWNVTLGTWHALDFSLDDSAEDESDLVDQGDDDRLLLLGRVQDKRETLAIDSGDAVHGWSDAQNRSPPSGDDIDGMPSVVFSNTKVLLAVHPTTREVLWKIETASAVASVFGVRKGRWRGIQVLSENEATRNRLNDPLYAALPLLPDNDAAVSRSLEKSPASYFYRSQSWLHHYQRDFQRQRDSRTTQLALPASRPHEPYASESSHPLQQDCPNLQVLQMRLPSPSSAIPSVSFSPTKNGAGWQTEGLLITWNQVWLLSLSLAVLVVTARGWYLKKKFSWINSNRNGELTRSSGKSRSNDEAGVVLRRSLSLPDHRAATVSSLATVVSSSMKERASSSDANSHLREHGLKESSLKSIPSKTANAGHKGGSEITNEVSATSPATEPPLSTVGATGIPLVRYSRYASEYKEVCPLGKGGFGSVFKCQNVLDGRYYAIKKVCIRGQSEDVRFEQRLERTLREVKILAVLDHPNIVRYFGAWLEIDKDDNSSQHVSGQAHCYSTSMFTESEWPLRHQQYFEYDSKHSLSEDSTSTSYALSSRRPQPVNRRSPLSDCGFVFEGSECEGDRVEIESRENEDVNVAESHLGPRCKVLHADRSTSNFNSSDSHLKAIRVEKADGNGEIKCAVASLQRPGDSSPGKAIRHILYIQMQLCSPKTVADFLRNPSARKGLAESGEIDVPLALRLFLQIAQAVRHVHDQGLIHRDLKPQNCFTDDAGTVRVGDFGLSRESADMKYSEVQAMAEAPLFNSSFMRAPHLDDHTVGVGTRAYASPEQMNGSDYDSSTDVFSLGIILFEMLYPMYTGMERSICLSQLRQQTFPVDWDEKVGLAFPTLKGLIQSMLSPDPQARPNAASVTQHVHTIMSEFTILSLDEHFRGQGPDVVLLRIEAENQPDALFRTIQAIEESAEESQQSVRVVQYGLRSSSSGEPAAIMEFALKFNGAAHKLVASLRHRPEILKVRQVSMEVHSTAATSHLQCKDSSSGNKTQ